MSEREEMIGIERVQDEMRGESGREDGLNAMINNQEEVDLDRAERVSCGTTFWVWVQVLGW